MSCGIRVALVARLAPTHRLGSPPRTAYPQPPKGHLVPPRPRAKGATILAVANQKGGVAKTTSVASLGAAFAELGNRVLLVDLDPQACLTYSLGIDPDQVAAAIHEVLTGATGLTEIIQECGPGVDLVPSSIELAGTESVLLGRPGREYILQEVLAPS